MRYNFFIILRKGDCPAQVDLLWVLAAAGVAWAQPVKQLTYQLTGSRVYDRDVDVTLSQTNR
jgi:hypothetical protein